MRAMSKFRVGHPALKFARPAPAALAVVTLLIAGACSESGTSKSVTDPALASTTAAAAANAKFVTLCVNDASPAGTYTFQNTAEHAGANGTTVFNKPVTR